MLLDHLRQLTVAQVADIDLLRINQQSRGIHATGNLTPPLQPERIGKLAVQSTITWTTFKQGAQMRFGVQILAQLEIQISAAQIRRNVGWRYH